MIKYIFVVLLSSKLLSCKDNSHSNDQLYTGKSSDTGKIISSNDTKNPAADVGGCYMKVAGRDTAILMLEQKGNELSGKMLYTNYEKDGSRGTVKGKEEGEILKLWYDFNSEGMHSVMEAYFKKEKSGKLLRGTGDMDAKTDTTYFISGINYSEKEAFTKVDCKIVEWELKF